MTKKWNTIYSLILSFGQFIIGYSLQPSGTNGIILQFITSFWYREFRQNL